MTAARDLDAVVTAYLECAYWSSNDEGSSMDELATLEDASTELLAQAREDCAAMIDSAADMPGADWWTDEQFGHDFWLTRNGHGAGFWDRHYGHDSDEAKAGDELTALASPYGSCDLYLGDDGKVYA